MAEKLNTTIQQNQYIKPIIDTLQGTVTSILEVAPKVIIGIILFLVGLLLFKIVRSILVKFFVGIGTDKISAKFGLSDMLAKFGIRSPFSQVLGATIFYLLMFHFTVELAAALDLTMISDPLVNIVQFLPHVITAVIVFIVGFLFADLVKRAVLRGAEGVGLDYAKTLAGLVYGFLLVMVTTLAVKELEIDTGLIESTVSIALGALGLAVAIALGFGLQGLARNVVSGAYARDAFSTGSTIVMDGEDYRVAYVGAISTKIEKDDGAFVMIPNAELVGQSVKGKQPV